MHERRGEWRRAHLDPTLAFLPQELALFGDLRGRRACVLGSGDNLAAFALAGLGASVTSVDVSERQLGVAQARRLELGLEVQPLCADVTWLPLAPECFDLVYTGGHVAVWVSDLKRFYAEAARVLKQSGLLVICEYHPFRRVFKYEPDSLQLHSSYQERGPHYEEVAEHLFSRKPGEIPSYQFTWTVSDFVRAVRDAGCQLLEFEELGDQAQGWEVAPLAGLPEHLLLAARKPPPLAR